MRGRDRTVRRPPSPGRGLLAEAMLVAARNCGDEAVNVAHWHRSGASALVMALACHAKGLAKGCIGGSTSGGLRSRPTQFTIVWRSQLSATAGGPEGTATHSAGERLGFKSGMVVQELSLIHISEPTRRTPI